MSVIELDRDRMIEQVLEFGYFAEQIPPCFSSSDFSQHYRALVNDSKCNRGSAPTEISTYKNDLSRRILSVPNPKSYLQLLCHISENWDYFVKVSKSKNSLSPLTVISSYQGDIRELINSEAAKDEYRCKSDYVKGVESNISISLGYKYRLNVDISNCYSTIYTHSVTWAVLGKDSAKKVFRMKKGKEKEAYDILDRLDKYTSYLKNAETNGILIGPFTSRIFSELILAGIDRELRKLKFVFLRYVDDYKFYFRSEYEIQQYLPIIEQVLNQFNLRLNESKTKIEKFPYEIKSDIQYEFKIALKSDGVFGLLNHASRAFSEGQKGAFKYALKMLRGCKFDENQESIVIATLINIVVLDPRYGKYVIQYINSVNHPFASLESKINQELEHVIKNNRSQEMLMFLHFMRELKLTIKGDNLLSILKSGVDLAILMALEMWLNTKERVSANPKMAEKINKAVNEIENSLRGESINQERWLLVYECRRKELLQKNILDDIQFDSFFQKMLQLNVAFFS